MSRFKISSIFRAVILTGCLLVMVQTSFAHVDLEYPEEELTFMVGDTVTVEWEETVPHNTRHWKLEYSLNGGDSWLTIKEEVAYERRTYKWIVPDTTSTEVQVRVTQVNEAGNYDDESGHFTIENGRMTSIEEPSDQPSAVHLLNNYPNPFNPSTTIAFKLNQSVRVKIHNLDSAGRLVDKFLDQRLPAARHRITYHAKSLASGIYYYRVKVQGESYVGKMMLLK